MGAKAMSNDKQRRRNLRLGLVLASVALALFIGFIVRITLLRG